MKLSPNDEDASESSPKVYPSGGKKEIWGISSMMSCSSSENPIEPFSQEAHVCETKITFTADEFYLVKYYRIILCI